MVDEDLTAEPAEPAEPAKPVSPSPVTVTRGRLVTGVAIVAVLAAVIGGLVGRWTASSSSGPGVQAMCQATTVAQTALPSVVTIFANSQSAGGGSGSGELIQAGGYILTNDHVISVATNGGNVSVLYSDGVRSAATIVGTDPTTDLAVLKAADGAEGRPLIPIGSSASLQAGQPVVALGAPLGLYSTVTSGIVSALDRYVPVPSQSGPTAHLVGAIQTDASINPGNSGGALVNCTGSLVGINTAIATVPNADGSPGGGSVGLGFAIPVDLAMPLADQIIKTGTVNHPSFGMQAQAIPAYAAKAAGVPGGLFVVGVAAGGPAAKAGIESGDIITEVNGQPATSVDQLTVLTLTKNAGDSVPMTYSRNGTSVTTEVTLAKL
ncbi:MAG TPA: trypsin-like peptidase domain-containing protein [Candidatus Nanopelagicales bacterium]